MSSKRRSLPEYGLKDHALCPKAGQQPNTRQLWLTLNEKYADALKACTRLDYHAFCDSGCMYKDNWRSMTDRFGGGNQERSHEDSDTEQEYEDGDGYRGSEPDTTEYSSDDENT